MIKRFRTIQENQLNNFDKNNYFTINGRMIKRFRTIQENQLNNFDKILLNVYE